eukprot:g38452.t1
MGEPEELVEGVSEINLNPAPAGFWKPWGEIEEKAPAEMKNPKLVRAPIGEKQVVAKVERIISENPLVGFVDSDFAEDKVSRKSREQVDWKLGDKGSSIGPRQGEG